MENPVVLSYADKWKPYQVSDEYVQITDEIKANYPNAEFARIGDGFVQLAVLQNLQKNEQIMELFRGYDSDVKILGFEHSQLYYMLLGEKTVYSGRTAIAKDYKATGQIIKQLDADKTLVRDSVTSMDQYYLYRYLAMHGYVYFEPFGLYMPNALHSYVAGQNGSLALSPWTKDIDLNDAAYAFAKSIKTMKTLEKCEAVTYQIVASGDTANVLLGAAVNGYVHDVVYVKLKDALDGKVTISFPSQLCEGGAGEVACNVKDGELLVPIGMNAGWLLDNQTMFTVKSLDGSPVDIVEIQFYHLKDL